MKDDVLKVSLLTNTVDPALAGWKRKAAIRNQFQATKALAKERKKAQAAKLSKVKPKGQEWRKAYREDLTHKSKRDCKVPSTDFNGLRRDGLTRPKNPIRIPNPKNKVRRIPSKGEKESGKKGGLC